MIPPGEHWQRFAGAIRDDLRTFDETSQRTRRALVSGLATTLAVLAALSLNLDFPMWSGISAFVVIQATARATAFKALLRIAGTVGGALGAAFLLGFAAGNNILFVLGLFLAISYPLYRSYRSAYPYAWMLSALTMGVILMAAMAQPGVGLEYAGYRAAEIAVGACLACAAAILLLPEAGDPAADRALAKPVGVSQPVAARTALEAGVGVVLVVLLYDWFDLPGFSAAAVSMTRIADPNPELGRHRGLLRLIGCLAGGGIAVAGIAASIQSIAGMAMIVFVAMTVFGYVFTGGPASAYAGMQAGLAFLLAFAPQATPATSFEPVVERLAGILLALAVFWLVDAVLGREEDGSPPSPSLAKAREGDGEPRVASIGKPVLVADAGRPDPVVDRRDHLRIDQP